MPPRDTYSMIEKNGQKFFCSGADEEPPGDEAFDDNEVEIRPAIKLTRSAMQSLKEEAERCGMSISEYVSDLIVREVE